MVLGAFVLKLFQRRAKFTNHQYIVYSSFAILLFNTLFSISIDPFFQGLWMFVVSMFYSSRYIANNICIILINPT